MEPVVSNLVTIDADRNTGIVPHGRHHTSSFFETPED
jgi:hypothetical protein